MQFVFKQYVVMPLCNENRKFIKIFLPRWKYVMKFKTVKKVKPKKQDSYIINIARLVVGSIVFLKICWEGLEVPFLRNSVPILKSTIETWLLLLLEQTEIYCWTFCKLTEDKCMDTVGKQPHQTFCEYAIRLTAKVFDRFYMYKSLMHLVWPCEALLHEPYYCRFLAAFDVNEHWSDTAVQSW